MKQQRLADRAAITQVFDGARYKVQNYAGLILARPNSLSYDRLVIIVGKKNIRRAVDRNRLKRLVRESFRRFPVSSSETELCGNGKDIVFVARKGALQSLWVKQDESALNKLWKKLVKSSKS